MSTRAEKRYYEFGAFRMDPLRRRLYGADGEAITLKPKVFDTLLFLVEHAGELLDKSTLMKGIWGDLVVEENSLNQHISILRRALGETPGDNRFIVTVQGRGYRFVASVREVPEEPEVADKHEPAALHGGRVRHADVQRPGTALSHGPVRLALTLIVLALGVGAAYYAFYGRFDARPGAALPPIAAQPAPNSVAILPFDNASDGDDLHLSITEGLGDYLREHLRRLPGSPLQVTWRSSSKMFRVDEDLAAIASSLPAAHVVHGTLSGRGDDLHARVEIFAAQGGETVWSKGYDFVASDLLSVEERIARDVTAQLLPGDVPVTVSRMPEVNEAVAHQLVTLGRLYEFQVRDDLVLDDDKLGQAIDAYRQATVADPDSGEAYSRLAAALLYRGDVDEAEAPLTRALELEPERSETQYTLALYRTRRGLHGIGEAYENAIAYDPNNADALGAYGQWLWGHRDAAGAQQYLERALELDKQSPTRWADYVEYLGGNNRRDPLLDVVDEIHARFPNPQGHLILARLYELTGDLDEGIAWALKAYEARPEDAETMGQLAELYARIGDFDSASLYEPVPGIGQLFLQRRYGELKDVAQDMLLDPETPLELNVWYFLAFAYDVSGDSRAARYALERTELPQMALTDSYTPAETQALATYIDALQATGDEAGARRYATRLAEILQRNVDSGMGDAWWPNTYLACVQAELGQVGAALDALDRVRTGSVGLPWSSLLVDSPCFRHLADEPGYQALVANVEERRDRLRAKLPATLARHGLSSLKTSATQ